MRKIVPKRYASWSSLNYGSETPPGVICRSTLVLDGREGSHLGQGWHAPEDGFRWSKGQAQLFLHRLRGQNRVEIEWSAGPERLGPTEVVICAGGTEMVVRPALNTWQRTMIKLPPQAAEQSVLAVVITAKQLRNARQLEGGDHRNLGVAVRSLRLLGDPQTTGLALSSVCNPAHWQHPFWQQCLQSLGLPDSQHRKLWEWVHGISGLARLGCLRPSVHALGIAAGHEPVIYWLANRVAKVYATDLYRGSFASSEANPDVLHNPDRYATCPYPRERVHFFPMSGTDISLANETVDLIFSFCSIEHFGSRANSRRSLQEMARVLRPGGVAVVSTEVLLNDIEPQEEIFSPWELYEELIAPSGLLLIGDIAPADLSTYFADPVDMSNVLAPKPHFVLHDNGMFFTSVMIFLQKVASYGDAENKADMLQQPIHEDVL